MRLPTTFDTINAQNPEIAIDIRLSWGSDFGRNRYQFLTEAGVAGEFTLCERRSEENERLLHFRNIERDYSVDMRKGIGLAVYLLFIEMYGNSFSSETVLRQGGLAVWRKLQDRGLAYPKKEPINFVSKDLQTYYAADYRAVR